MKFQKGNKYGKGRLPVPVEANGLRLMNQRELEIILNRHIHKSVEELVSYSANAKNPTIDVLVAKILIQAIKRGDQNRLDFILNRLIGKPKELHDHTHNVKVSYHSEIMKMIHDAETIDIESREVEEIEEDYESEQS